MEQKELTSGQKQIIDGLKSGFFDIDNSENHTTTLRAIRNAVPSMDDKQIGDELKNWEGVQRVGDNMDDQISIPGKYFK